MVLCVLLLQQLNESSLRPAIVVQSVLQSFQRAATFTVTANGAIVVIDQGSNSASYHAVNTNKTKTIGGKGWGNFEFDNPTDVSSSFLLETFIVDYNNQRIQKYDKDLNFVRTYDERSVLNLEGRFYPRACATSSQGDLFVVESDGKRILKINRRSQIEREFGTFKDGAGALREPRDIAVSSADEIYILDMSSIKIYDVFGNYLRTIVLDSGIQWKNLQVYQHTVIATSADSVKLYSLDGIPRMTISHSSTRLGESSIIGVHNQEKFQDVCIVNDSLYILTETTLYRCSIRQ